MVIKYDKNSVKLCQNKFSLIMSDNFDRKVCDDYNQPKLFRQLLVWQYLHNYQYFVGPPLQPLMQTWTSIFSQNLSE